jgi:hypothetical protein
MRTRLPALVLVAAVLAIAGCGGSSKTSSSSSSTNTTSAGTTATSATTAAVTTSSGPPLSKSQLVARAGAICKRVAAELNAAPSKLRSEQDVVHIAALRVGIEQKALTELSKLTPPASMKQGYQQLLTDRQTLIEDTKKIGEYSVANNGKAAQPLYVTSAGVLRQMEATAQRNHFKYCGKLA